MRREFIDDCGAWNTKLTSVKNTYFLQTETGNLVTILKRADIFYEIVKQKNAPLYPQPTSDEVFLLKRYYSTLAHDASYKKPVSWFERMPGNLYSAMNVAVAEYLGMRSLLNPLSTVDLYVPNRSISAQHLLLRRQYTIG